MPADQHESEWQTRKKRIDTHSSPLAGPWCPLLTALRSNAYDRCAIAEFPTSNGPADYAFVLGGRILGIVEAKKLSLGPQNALVQAERYSRGATVNPLSFRRIPRSLSLLHQRRGHLVSRHSPRSEPIAQNR